MHNKTRHLGYIVQFFKRAETLKSVKSPQNAVKTHESFLDFILTIFRQLLFQPETARRAFSKRKTDFMFIVRKINPLQNLISVHNQKSSVK